MHSREIQSPAFSTKNLKIKMMPLRKDTIRRFLFFCIVGLSGVFVDMGILFCLADSKMLGWNLCLSKAISAEAAILNNFLWNNIWTFSGIPNQRQNSSSWLVRLGKFNLICLAGIGISILLLNGQVKLLHLNVYLANLSAILITSLWNFTMNLKFNWQNQV